MVILSLKGISKEYGHSLVLNNIDLDIEEGDIIGIIGVSGSGKSTLLNIITGFLKSDDGVMKFNIPHKKKEFHITHNNFVKQILGYNPQGLSFYPKLSVWENLMHFGRMYNLKKRVLKDNANNLLKFTGLYKYRKYLAEELSGGMQKRLDIACSLVHKPKILVLDEPVLNLDSVLKRDILHLLEEVNKQGVTIILASHDLETVDLICNRVAILHNNKMFSQGPIDEIKKPYNKGGTIRLFTGSHHKEILEHMKQIPKVSVVDYHNHLVIQADKLSKVANEITNYVESGKFGLTHLDLSAPALRTVFEDITHK